MKLRVGFAAIAFAIVAVTLDSVAVAAEADKQPLYEDLGNYHYQITTSVPLAQQYFDQGLRLYYAFNHAEAIRAFRMAQDLDPSCAMCWWGEALAWGPNINLPMDVPSAQAAYTASSEAIARKSSASPKERALIDALSLRYSATPTAQRSDLDKTYADAMSPLVRRYDEDLDIRVLYAESLMDLRPWDYWREDGTPQEGMDVALDYLEDAMDKDAQHPGACHFYIHAVEEVYPQQAVACAERLATLMPGAGHLVHMPGHIYIRVGRYLDAVVANEHAVHADETYIRDQHPSMGMYTAGYYPHNYDFMAFAAMMIGRSQLSVESAQKITSLLPEEMFGSPGMDWLQHYSVRPLLMQVRFAQWEEILLVQQPPADRLHALAIWNYAQGRAHVALGNMPEANTALARLREISVLPELTHLRMEFNSSSELIAIADRVLTGWKSVAVGDFATAISAIQQAVLLESELLYGEPPEWSVPTLQDLGAVYLLANKAKDAEAAFRSDLQQFPENGWSLHGLARALKAQNKPDEADEVEAVLERVWSTADVKLERVF